tara:strand:- start:4465 stop:5148 length:684 start_codon:yes stop_codon:yes gene_type:complete
LKKYHTLGGKELFYEKTGMYIDFDQLDKLPEIDTLIDIGVGPFGTPDLYEKFNPSYMLLIDPVYEAKLVAEKIRDKFDLSFHHCGVGSKPGELTLNVEAEFGYSSFLEVADINFRGEPADKRIVQIKTLDSIVLAEDRDLGKIGVKIDTEGFELDVIKGSKQTLEMTEFVIAEVRHNHESFNDMYKLHEFVSEMHDNDFVLSMILTAKPFIADLCFQPKRSLSRNTD